MKLSKLRQFEQFSQLTDEQLILLKSSLKSKRCTAGEQLMARGFNLDLEFFLLEGSISLTAEDGQRQEISAGSPAARLSIARLRPSLHEVHSLSVSHLLAVPGSLLTRAVKTAIRQQTAIPSLSALATGFYQQLEQALENQTFHLPSLPGVAMKVREVLQQEEPELADLENILNKDPAMAAKLVAAANSPLYQRGTPCKTCSAAIKRLGLNITSQLVMLFSLRQLFKARHTWVRQRMIQTWSQGVRVAAITQLLTLTYPHLSGDQALLLGLVHNLGELAILKFIDQEQAFDAKATEDLLEELMPAAGALLLSNWNFDAELVESLRQLNNWQADRDRQEVTLDDLLRVARLHSLIGTQDQYRYPRLDEVPAFRKLTDQGLTPELSLTLVEDAADQVAEVQAMFGL